MGSAYKFREMRRIKRKISDDEALIILKEGEYGVLSTFGEDGWPYGVPLSYVYDDGKLYFHMAKEGHKIDNLTYCDKASFTVIGDTHVLQELISTAYESTIVFGTVHPVDDSEKTAALMKLAEKYCYDNLDIAEDYIGRSLANVAIYCFEIAHISGKARTTRS